MTRLRPLARLLPEELERQVRPRTVGYLVLQLFCLGKVWVPEVRMEEAGEVRAEEVGDSYKRNWRGGWREACAGPGGLPASPCRDGVTRGNYPLTGPGNLRPAIWLYKG